MKKIFAILIIAFMCLTLSACGADKDIIGTWRAEVSAVGESVSEAEHYAYVCFDEEGNCTNVFFAGDTQLSESSVKYTAESGKLKMTVDSREIVCDYEIDGNEMTISYGGNTQVLERIAYDVVFKSE